MKILITGVAGFIGYNLTKFLLKKNFKVTGVDFIRTSNKNDLRVKRLNELKLNQNFFYINKNLASNYFNYHLVDCVVHLAAQAGVYQSFNEPYHYLQNNILSFQNIIDYCKNNEVPLIYASSSSVYNHNLKNFKENHIFSSLNNIYALSKHVNEQVADIYYQKYNLKTVGLRFFSIYGPFGRPDMAYYIFSENIRSDKSINLFNNGNDQRDFTFIDDILDPILYLIKNFNKIKNFQKIYNLGNNSPVKIKELVKIISTFYNKIPKIVYLEKRIGEANLTKANIELAKKNLNFVNKTDINKGMKKFLNWHKNFS